MSRIIDNRNTVVVAMITLIAIGTVAIFTFKPEHPKIWAGGLIIIVGIGAAVASYVMARRKINSIFAQREILDDDTIYSRFYADSGLTKTFVIELWHEIADTLGISPGKLRPTDRFGHEIGISYSITTEALDTLTAVAVRRAKKYQGSIDLAGIKTADDYIRQFAALAGRRPEL